MAHEAGLEEREYWKQIIKACFLDEKIPSEMERDERRQMEHYRTRLNRLAPNTDRLHVVGPDVNLWIKLGEKRKLAGAVVVIFFPFELFTSPDWRGTPAGFASINPLSV